MTRSDHQPLPPLELPGVAAPALGSRDLFPHLEARAYLAHAAISPACAAVVSAVQECLMTVARLGVGSFPVYDAQRDRLRFALGELFGVEASDLALTGGTTRGITDIALALPLSPADELVAFQGEFPANVTPWQLACESSGARMTLLPQPDLQDPERSVEQVEERLRAGARWVAVSAVQFQTGLRMPLEALAEACQRHDAHLLVDAIQAAGVVPVDAGTPGISAMMGGAHKWLLGLEGAGWAYVSPELQARLRPRTAGWLSHVDGDLFLFKGSGHLRYDRPLKNTPEVFEGSTASITGFVALEAGVDVVRALGPVAIFEHVQRYHDLIEPLLVEQGFDSLRAAPGYRSGNLSFSVPVGVSSSGLAAELRRRGFVVSTPDGYLRLAPHFGNSLDEPAVLSEAIRESLLTL